MKFKASRGKLVLSVILSLVFFAFLLYYFKTSSFSKQSKLDIVDLPGIQLDIMEASYTGANYSVTNTSEHAICFGYDFGIEVFNRNNWAELPHSDTLTSTIQLELLPGQSDSFTCNWESTYGLLKAGQYRLVKRIIAYDGSLQTSHWIACEFVLH